VLAARQCAVRSLVFSLAYYGLYLILCYTQHNKRGMLNPEPDVNIHREANSIISVQ
jgi:hypothetical protein